MDKEIKKQTKNSKNKNKPKKGIKNMGINIDKNEYMEIILSNSNHPEATYQRQRYFD